MGAFEPGSMSTVIVVEDHGIVREGLVALLERNPHIDVVASAGNGRDALEVARRFEPDVVVMDMVLPELGGLDATRRIVSELPRTRVVILSVHHDAEHVFQALRAGALGYLSKQAAPAELVDAVLTVSSGQRYLSKELTNLADVPIESQPRSPLERLSAREREVLQLTVAGATSAEIARRLFLSPKTVETYRARVREKLGVADQAALIRFAIQNGVAPE